MALTVSICMHLALALRLVLAGGPPASRGEDGLEGGGGATFEVEIAGDVSPDRPPLPGDVDSTGAGSVSSLTPLAPSSENLRAPGRSVCSKEPTAAL